MADTVVLGATASACGFKSRRPHQKKPSLSRLREGEGFMSAVRVLYSITSSLKTTGRMPSLQQLMQVLLPSFSQRPP